MNPDFHKTADHTIYTMIHPDGDHTVAFHVYKDHVEIRSSMGPSRVSLEEARKAWKELVRRGFTLSNKSVVHDMEKFHNVRRKEERNKKVMKSISDSMDKYIKKIHHNDFQEMRVNPKKLYTDNWDNYALQA